MRLTMPVSLKLSKFYVVVALKPRTSLILLIPQDGKTVFLIFSVQGSGHFQGYAKMTSEIGRDKTPEFSAPGLSGTFSIEWVKRWVSLCLVVLSVWNELC